MSNPRNNYPQNTNNPLVSSAKILANPLAAYMDLPSQIYFSQTCRQAQAFFKNQVSISELLKLIATYDFKPDSSRPNKNIHATVMSMVEKILKTTPQLSLTKGTHTTYTRGHLGALFGAEDSDDDEEMPVYEQKQEQELRNEKQKKLAEKIKQSSFTFKIPRTFHESPLQCAYRTGNQFLYNLIFKYVKDLPDAVTIIKNQISELEAFSRDYDLLLLPTLGFGQTVESLLPAYNYIFIQAENEELPQDIPANSLLLKVINTSVKRILQIYEPVFELELPKDLAPVKRVNMSEECFTSISLLADENVKAISRENSEELFNKILGWCEYPLPVLRNKVTLIKQYNENFKTEFFIWARACGKWSLTEINDQEYFYQELLPLPFPDCNSAPVVLNSSQIKKEIYDAFDSSHTELFDAFSVIKAGITCNNKTVKLKMNFFMQDESEQNKRKVVTNLWLEVGREQQTFPAWFMYLYNLEFFLFLDKNNKHNFSSPNEFWHEILNFQSLMDVDMQLFLLKTGLDNLGIYWTMQLFARSRGVILDRSYYTIRSYQKDMAILQNLGILIASARVEFKELLKTFENKPEYMKTTIS